MAPYEILRIEKHEGSVASHVLYEENIEESNQEMIEHDNQSYGHKEKVDPSALSLSLSPSDAHML